MVLDPFFPSASLLVPDCVYAVPGLSLFTGRAGAEYRWVADLGRTLSTGRLWRIHPQILFVVQPRMVVDVPSTESLCEIKEAFLADYFEEHPWSGRGGRDPEELTDAELLEKCPTLHRILLTTRAGERGEEYPRVSVFVEDGVWKAYLRDPESSRYVCVSGNGFWNVLEVLEHQLSRGTAVWRLPRSLSQRHKK